MIIHLPLSIMMSSVMLKLLWSTIRKRVRSIFFFFSSRALLKCWRRPSTSVLSTESLQICEWWNCPCSMQIVIQRWQTVINVMIKHPNTSNMEILFNNKNFANSIKFGNILQFYHVTSFQGLRRILWKVLNLIYHMQLWIYAWWVWSVEYRDYTAIRNYNSWYEAILK